ncbi:arylsulfatase [Opitutaceae bacterium]|nr:arylsulfatase [Opitutaceae bacterium]
MNSRSKVMPDSLNPPNCRWGTLLPIFLMTLIAPFVGRAAASPPNILFIYADDLGYGDVACYNPESKVPTPHLDRLATEGMLFTDAHSPSTVCTPSRYSVMTGRMAFRLGYPGVFTGVQGPCLIAEDRLTLPELLRDSGYETALFGKWHIGMTFFDRNGRPVYEQQSALEEKYGRRESGVPLVNLVDFSKPIAGGPLDHGFDQFYGTVCCPTTDWLYAFIEGDRIPTPPNRILDREAEGLPAHPYSKDNRIGMLADGFDLQEVDMVFLDKSRQFLEDHAGRKSEKPFFLFHSAQAVHLPSFPGRDFQGKTDAGPHGDFIFQFDAIVGELMQTLERLDLANNTLVIVTSDNGPEVNTSIHMRKDHDHNGSRPWRGMKRDQWEAGHRVPFIARWPGKIPAGSVSEQTISQTDIMATCAELVGRELPFNAAEDSYSIVPALLGTDAGAPIRPYTLHQTIRLELAIRQGDWKYLDHQGSGGNNYATERLGLYALPDNAPSAPGQLYNLRKDPGETRNLYHEHPEVVERLKALLETSKRTGRSR